MRGAEGGVGPSLETRTLVRGTMRVVVDLLTGSLTVSEGSTFDVNESGTQVCPEREYPHLAST